MPFWRRRTEDRTLPREDTYPTLGPTYAETVGVGQVESITPTAALRIADVWACVRVLADSAASLPLVAYRRSPNGDRERFRGRLANLLDRPAPATTQANLVGQLVAHLLLHGDAFLGKYRDDRGTVVQLGALDPTAIQVEIRAGEPLYTLMRPSGVSEHGVEDILHIRSLSTDGVRGLSPIAQARAALSLNRSMGTHAESFARHGRAGGVLRLSNIAASPEDEATDATVLTEKLADPTKSGGVLVLTGSADDVDFTQWSLSMVDAQWVEQRQLSTQEIARIFRVPPNMIGAPTGESLTYSTFEGQALAFVKFSLDPWLVLVEQSISSDPDLSPSSVYVEFLRDALLRADSKTRAEVYALALDPDRGWLTRDEVRKLENYPQEGST
jgi:HK97 family phage portal protein